MFSSNIFKRSVKEIKYTHTNTQGNQDITNVKGYSCAIIQFSEDVKYLIGGYIDADRNSQAIYPLIAGLDKKWIRNDVNNTTKTIIVDVSNLSCFFINYIDSFTGNVFILLTQEKFNIEWNGITRLFTKYINVVSGTNKYDLGFIDGFSPFRFYAIQVRRRDGSGYVAYSGISIYEYQKINKEQGAGPAYGSGKLVLSGNSDNNGWMESEWIENYTDSIALEVSIDGETYDGALLEINVIGIA